MRRRRLEDQPKPSSRHTELAETNGGWWVVGEGSILLRPGSHLPVVPTFVGYARETHSATRLALRVQ